MALRNRLASHHRCTSGLTSEQQRDMIALAASKASASSGIAAAAVAERGEVVATRISPLGESRIGTVFWDLTCSPALTGSRLWQN